MYDEDLDDFPWDDAYEELNPWEMITLMMLAVATADLIRFWPDGNTAT